MVTGDPAAHTDPSAATHANSNDPLRRGKGKFARAGGPSRGEPCSIVGCKNKAKARGVCVKHGACGQCKAPDCTFVVRPALVF